MAVDIETRDCISLTDSDLDEMAAMGTAFGIGAYSKAKEDWVLSTTCRDDGRLHGFTFSTLERIGGTPCVLLGLMSVKRSSNASLPAPQCRAPGSAATMPRSKATSDRNGRADAV